MSSKTSFKYKDRLRLLLISGMVFSVVLSSTALFGRTAFAIGQSFGQSEVLPPNQLVAKLGDKWWQWGFAINTKQDADPFSNTGQAGCDIGLQKNLNVIFLVGSIPSDPTKIIEHNCSIPVGKSIFFPILNVACNSLDAPPFFGKNEDEQRECSKGFADKAIDLAVTIDGKSLKHPQQYRIDSPKGGFKFTAVENNPFATPVGQGTGVSDGYLVYLTPPSLGKHKISFTGTFDLDNNGKFDPTKDVKFAAIYNISVKVKNFKHDYVESLDQVTTNAESPMSGMKDMMMKDAASKDNPSQLANDDVFGAFPRFPDFPSLKDMSSMEE